MFKNKTIIITGGSSGAGKELADRLAKAGAHLAIIARDQGKLDATTAELRKNTSTDQQIAGFSCDVTDPEAVESTIARIAETFGPPQILINSAGILREGYFENQGLETFREVMDINFFGALHCIKAVLPYFIEARGGRVVNIASVAGLMGVFGYTAYCASKHALIGLTSSLRAELAPKNIRFHVVCPPEFESPMVEGLAGRTPENIMMAHTIPVMTAASVAEAVIRGMERDQYEIVPSLVARAVVRSDRWFPALSRAIVDFQIRRCYKGPERINEPDLAYLSTVFPGNKK